ncbi:MAG: dihydroorotate dehydrogenase electron transfer subunit [Candidatus Thorarchaeota archaeon]
MTENVIRTVRIQKIIDECDGIKTFFFNMKNNNPDCYIKPKPGQFVMVWVPGVDEIPMSLSGCNDKGDWSITVKEVGECTKAIHNLKIGDYIGIRGPLGNYFKIPEDLSKKIILVSGGIGTAPLKFLATHLNEMGISFDLIKGTKNNDEIIFASDFQQFNHDTSNIIYCTEFDDHKFEDSTRVAFYNSKFEELAHTRFEALINEYFSKNISDFIVFTCGPEIMMYKVFQICQKYKIELYASLERIMRCGCGLCGLCALDPLGLLVCKDGPIFNLESLKKIQDFGKFQRDFTGKKINIE